MPGSQWDFDTTTDNDARDVLRPKSPKELADQFGIRVCIASVVHNVFCCGDMVCEQTKFREM